jgi:hypothetical protein
MPLFAQADLMATMTDHRGAGALALIDQLFVNDRLLKAVAETFFYQPPV